MGKYKDTYRALYAIAERQGGCFTARQALGVGYGYPEQSYHAAQGNWERLARGIFRLRDFPPNDEEQLIVLTLMSIDHTGEPQAVVSHETALTRHEISDANPRRIHLTVPPGFRKHLPAGLKLHRGILAPCDWRDMGGYRLTTPLRTVLDIAATPASLEHVIPAVRDALRRRLLMVYQLEPAARDKVQYPHLQQAIEMAIEALQQDAHWWVKINKRPENSLLNEASTAIKEAMRRSPV